MAPSQPEKPPKSVLRPPLIDTQFSALPTEVQFQQAGRSSSNLNAQHSAQSLRNSPWTASRTSSSSTSPGSPWVSPPESRLHTPVQESAALATAPLSNDVSNDGLPSSELQHNARKSSDGSAGSSSQHADSAATKSSGKIGTPGAMSERASISQSPPIRPPLRPAQSSRFSAPQSIRDLGSDYTRYYNPFATRNNSEVNLLPPVPRDFSARQAAKVATTTPDLERRFVDPFADNRDSLAASAMSEKRESSTAGAKSPLPPTTVASLAGEVQVAALIDIPDLERDPCPPYIDDRFKAPNTLLLFTNEPEDDDEMHLPKWDDDIKYKAHWRDHLTAANVINSIGGIFVVLGLMCVFVALPVISWTGTSILDYPNDSPAPTGPAYDAWTHVNNKTYPLLQHVRTGLIDPDTPSSAKTRTSVTGEELVLVFSDEFNAQNRTFYPGDDPFWFAPDIWYGATQDLEWYDPDAVNTGGGTLQLQLDQFPNHGLDFRSGMLNSWNQICFKGGVFEVSVSLPGPAGVHGLWPGIWTMGNLGRPGYLSTTDGLWPYTYNECDTGITPNQSMTDGTSFLPGQRLPSCTCSNADHPTPGTGRGAPEIDIAEVSADYGNLGLGVATQSYQVAPFDIWYYPNYDFMETPNYNLSFVNTYTGGPYQQAVSTTSMLNNDWYDGKEFQKYAYEYTPGGDADSAITWTIGNEEMMRFDARAIGPNGNIGQRLVSEEPMSIIMNLGISHSWTYINFGALTFPTVLQVDYVRWYQPKDSQMVTCDPPGYETTEYIASHPKAYNNPNYTHWADTGYEWPQNTLMNGCSA